MVDYILNVSVIDKVHPRQVTQVLRAGGWKLGYACRLGPNEMLEVEERDISDDVLHANGFIAV
jgi:hypothetical protein